jgi:N-acetylglucosamine-6-phosphate deacetylase
LRRHRIIASIGHSNASYNEALEGIRAGISHATHTFNAMSGLESRSPGVTGAVLDSAAVTAEVIADLVHVHGSGVEVLLKTKGIDDIIFVTDSVTHARHGGAKKSLGAYRFENGRLAGSCLTMNRAVANAAATLKLSVPEVVRPATLNPARLLGIAARKGSVGVGKDADIVIFDAKFDVKLTMIKGDIIHRARGI